MDLRDLWRLDATAQAALVRDGEVTPAELVEAAIGRIERLDPRLNAVVTKLYDRARAQVERLDAGAPFAGVPMLVKDACLQIEGTPYYLGLGALRDAGNTSDITTELARRFERAGLVVLAKTNVPELSATASTEPRAFGPTRNPWDLSRTPGGSSGGSAAAVASGMVAVAHGADGGGSLRYPAAACGVVTLRPTYGRVPSETPTGAPDDLGVWTEFVLARSVRDLARMLDAVAPAPDAAPPPPPRLRVGMLTHDVMAGLAVDTECAEAVRGAGSLLASLGHDVVEEHPPALDGMIVRIWPSISKLTAVTRPPLYRWIAAHIGRELTQDDLEETMVSDADAARVSPAARAGALSTIAREAQSLRAWWGDGNDLLITPVLRQPPWPLGGRGGADDAGVFPFPFSLSGQPSMSFPLHWTPSGLPAGVQLVAAAGRDDILLRVAAQLEQAAPWAGRWPAVELEP